jgi:hypothetical protein
LTSTAARPEHDALARRARASLEVHQRRFAVGVVKLVGAILVLWVLAQLVWLMRVVGAVGVSRAWQSDAFGGVIHSVVSMAVVAVVLGAATGPLLRHYFAGALERGVVVQAKITRGPDPVLARLSGGALDIAVLDRVLGFFVPLRVTSFEMEVGGRSYRELTAFLYPDQTPVAHESGGGVLVLVDPQRPATRAWLVRSNT